MIRRLPLASGALLAATLLLAPLGEGGARAGNLAVLQTLVVLAVAAALAQRPADGARPPAGLLLAGAFLGWCALGTLRAPYRFGSFTTTADVALAVAVLWTTWRTRPSPALRRALVALILAAGGIEAAAALWQRWIAGAARAPGTFLNPNHLGSYLNLALALACGRLLARQAPGRAGRERHLGASLVLALCLAAQVTAVASRGALLATFGVLGITAWIAARTPRRRAALLVLAGLLLVAAGVGLAHRFSGAGDPYRYGRIEIWRASLAAAAESPVAGVGPGMFRHVAERYNFPRFEGPVRYGRTFRSTHSQYLDVLVETGMVGLALFLAAAVGLGAAIARRSAGSAPDDGTRVGVLLALGTLAVHGLVENVLLPPAVSLTAAALAGLALAPPRRPAPRRVRGGYPDLAVPLTVACLAAASYHVAVVAPLLGHLHFERMTAAEDPLVFRDELGAALRFNPYQAYYYDRAARAILAAVPRLDPASYTICYDYAAKAALLQPRDPHLRLLRARVSARGFREVFHDRAGLDEALSHFRAAIDLAPTDPRPAAALAGFLLDLDRPEEALAASETALAIEPAFVAAHRLRAAALRASGRTARARREEEGLAVLEETLAGYDPQNAYEAVILGRDDAGG